MSEYCENGTGYLIKDCPCEMCAPETYGPIDDECLAKYDEEGCTENEWRLVHACKEIRRLQQANEQLTKAITSGHVQREFEELKAENAKLRKVVEAARQIRATYPPSTRLLSEALRELDEDKS